MSGGSTGQSFMDRVQAAKYTISGSGLGKTVCKATTEEIAAPKKKHIQYLLYCTTEPNVSISHLADLLVERAHNSSWVIAFKSLITIHNLMNLGNERFTLYLASNNSNLSLVNFNDKSSSIGSSMSTLIRQYSNYVNEKSVSYRVMAFDFCKVKRGKENGFMRTVATEKLLKAIPILQNQLDAVLNVKPFAADLTNSIVRAAFLLLYKDVVRLFASYNEGMINLIEKYFDMNKRQCRDSLSIYKGFLSRMDQVTEFLSSAEDIGDGERTNIALQAVPPSVLEALEQHLAYMEGRGSSKSQDKLSTKGDGANNLNTTVQVLQNSLSMNTMQEGLDNLKLEISDAERQQIFEEENAELKKFRSSQEQSKDIVDPLHTHSISAASITDAASTGASVHIQSSGLTRPNTRHITASPEQNFGSVDPAFEAWPQQENIRSNVAAVPDPPVKTQNESLLLLGFDGDDVVDKNTAGFTPDFQSNKAVAAFGGQNSGDLLESLLGSNFIGASAAKAVPVMSSMNKNIDKDLVSSVVGPYDPFQEMLISANSGISQASTMITASSGLNTVATVVTASHSGPNNQTSSMSKSNLDDALASLADNLLLGPNTKHQRLAKGLQPSVFHQLNNSSNQDKPDESANSNRHFQPKTQIFPVQKLVQEHRQPINVNQYSNFAAVTNNPFGPIFHPGQIAYPSFSNTLSHTNFYQGSETKQKQGELNQFWN